MEPKEICCYQIIYLIYKQDYKPGYVVGDHLSRAAVTNRLKQPT